MKNFSIREIQTLSNIKAHTLRGWERRYRAITPDRGATITRSYSVKDLSKILYYDLLCRSGFRISRLSGLSLDDLRLLAANLNHDDLRKEKVLVEMLISMYQLDTEEFDKIVNESLTNWDAGTVQEQIIYPFLCRTGLLWRSKNRAEEHLVVAILRNKLIRCIENAGMSSSHHKRVLLFLPEQGQPDLMMLYTHYFLKVNGFYVLYMGGDVSLDDLAVVMRLKKPDHVLTYLPKRHSLNLSRLSLLMKEQVPQAMLIVATDPQNQPARVEEVNVKMMEYDNIMSFFWKP